MDQSGKRELLLIGFLLIVLLAFGIGATVIFVRQYRKEKK